MRSVHRFVLIASVLLVSLCTVAPASAGRARTAAHVTPVPSPCQPSQGIQSPYSPAKWLMCIPASGWNGDLVVWAHGYTAYNQPLAFQDLQIGNIYLPTLVQRLGFAFAATTYPRTGLAMLEGVDDIAHLVNAFNAQYRNPLPATAHTYMTGASEGGIVTTLLIERHPELFSGGLAACGPIGDFPGQIDYWGDYRTLFNYFFPNVIPTDPATVTISQTVIDNWDSVYKPAVTAAITANPGLAAQLIRTANAPIDSAAPAASMVTTTLDVMGYNVIATNDGIQELHGNPYDNRFRWYHGSSNDLRLNLDVQRVAADPPAIDAMNAYQTSGNLTRPLVTLHTTGDDVIPFWHEILYAVKARPTGAGRLTQIPVPAYGHCNFTASEILGAFALLVSQTGAAAPWGIPSADLARVEHLATQAVRMPGYGAFRLADRAHLARVAVQVRARLARLHRAGAGARPSATH